MSETTTYHDARITITSELDGSVSVMSAALVCDKWGNDGDSLTIAHEYEGYYTIVYVVNSAQPEPQTVYAHHLSAWQVSEIAEVSLSVVQTLRQISQMCEVRSGHKS